MVQERRVRVGDVCSSNPTLEAKEVGGRRGGKFYIKDKSGGKSRGEDKELASEKQPLQEEDMRRQWMLCMQYDEEWKLQKIRDYVQNIM